MSLLWTCKCGFQNWLHHHKCYQCFEPKPEGQDNGVRITEQTKAKPEKREPGHYDGIY